MMQTMVRAAIDLIEMSTEFARTRECDGENGRVAMYTYESAQSQIPRFKEVIRASRPFMRPNQCKWHWCLFTREGLYQCYSDGRNYNCDGDAFEDDVSKVWTDDELRSEGVDPSPPK